MRILSVCLSVHLSYACIVTKHVSRLVCRYHAEPEPRVMWLFNGAQIYASDHVTVSGNANQSTLTINGATLLDTGEYVCSASNTLGQATTKTFLRVRSMTHRYRYHSYHIKGLSLDNTVWDETRKWSLDSYLSNFISFSSPNIISFILLYNMIASY